MDIGVILPLASRTATLWTDQMHTLEGARGLLLICNQTVQAATETIQLKLQTVDPISGTEWANICNWTALPTVGTWLKAAYPAALNNGASFWQGMNVALPRRWRLEVTHSASGAHTYSIWGQYLF